MYYRPPGPARVRARGDVNVPIVLAGMAATVFGVADFLGGTAARRVPPLTVAMLAQVAGLVGLLLLMLVMPAAALPGALLWGLLAGLSGGVGVPVLYRALARGPMNVVAPLAALTSAAVPVLVGTLLGDRPSTWAWVGIVLAVVAGVVVGVSFEPTRDAALGDGALVDAAPAEVAVVGSTDGARRGALRSAGLSLFAGVCFGGFFVLIAQAAPAAGLWPVVAAKVGGSLVAVVVLVGAARVVGPGARRGTTPADATGLRLGLTGFGWRLAVLGGVLDALANVFYLLATQHGQLAVVGAVVGLYPASTVLLARLMHGERIGGVQWAGLALAVPALALVGAG
jgi:drug/metabolite transporter (DMT)-like permease